MKIWLIALALTLATPAHARIAHVLFPMETAPVERVIANVSADKSLIESQRQRLLGRLYLIAYAQQAAQLNRLPSGEWVAHDDRCGDPAYRYRSVPPGAHCPATQNAAPSAVPEVARVADDGVRRHLLRARRHYARAVRLDGSDPRARLGYAFVLDRLGRDEDARAQLRATIELVLPRVRALREHVVDWETLAVLQETIDHLALAQSPADANLITEARADLETVIVVITVTPIVVPLMDAPFAQLTDPASPVAFDFAGTGDIRAQGWLTPDAAWLVWDPEHRGEIRSGFDLIGQRAWAVFWSDGFEAMRSLDDNGDGELAGAELGGLALWRDGNSDGVSDPGEVLPLTAHGVAGLAVRGTQERPGLIVAPAGVRLADGRRRPLYDWTPGLNSAPSS